MRWFLRILVVRLYGYIHLVPMIETEGHRFLKTIIPNRKANRFYKTSAPAGPASCPSPPHLNLILQSSENGYSRNARAGFYVSKVRTLIPLDRSHHTLSGGDLQPIGGHNGFALNPHPYPHPTPFPPRNRRNANASGISDTFSTDSLSPAAKGLSRSVIR